MAGEKDRRFPKTRIDYFKRPHPLRTWKWRLSLACAAIASGWILFHTLAGDRSLYNPAPLASVHSPLESNCAACHTGGTGALVSLAVTDDGCVKCHAGPPHHPNQIFAGHIGTGPACGTCHVEHQGRLARLRSLPDGACIQCHSSLEVAPEAPVRTTAVSAEAQSNPVHGRLNARPVNGYARVIRGFDGHPEFRLKAEGFSDDTPLKLNHFKHLRSGLPGPNGTRVQMRCQDCHRQDALGAMIPIEFESNCQSCHSLAFDSRIREEAPHESPEIVAAFMRTAFSKYAGAHTNEWKTAPDWHPVRGIASLRRMLEEAPTSLPQWVEQRFVESRRIMLEKKCRECHTVRNAESAVPEVQAPAVPERWFIHSRFSHKPHQVLECTSCHANAPKSASTSDPLLPGKSSCIACHSSANDSLSRCTTCHAYHAPARTEN